MDIQSIIALVPVIANKILQARVPSDVEAIRAGVHSLHGNWMQIHFDYTTSLDLIINEFGVDFHRCPPAGEYVDADVLRATDREAFITRVGELKHPFHAKRQEVIRAIEVLDESTNRVAGRVAEELRVYFHCLSNYFQIPFENYDTHRYTVYESIEQFLAALESGDYEDGEYPNIFWQVHVRLTDMFDRICEQHTRVTKAHEIILW
jgi:hypothetical protein